MAIKRIRKETMDLNECDVDGQLTYISRRLANIGQILIAAQTKAQKRIAGKQESRRQTSTSAILKAKSVK